MKFQSTFSEILQASIRSWNSRRVDECILSFALPIERVDPLFQVPIISNHQQFSFLWDLAPDLCIAAAGKCQSFELLAQRRFELAQRFTDETFNRLIDGSPDTPFHAKARILYAFTFFEQTSEFIRDEEISPAVQAVLPSWQLTSIEGCSWLRLNAVVAQEADVRDFVEKLWLMCDNVMQFSYQKSFSQSSLDSLILDSKNWERNYQLALGKGIELVESEQLKKLVLAVKQLILLKKPLDPLNVLTTLRNSQKGSCRFLWQRSKDESFFGASPERLLSLRQDRMITDALAGTAVQGHRVDDLLRSDKDLREHNLVVSSIRDVLLELGLSPKCMNKPRLAKHGKLVHLHTPITLNLKDQSALKLVDALHPTPAVAGLPRTEALNWLRTLEPFDRGSYAAPIGWIDTAQNAEFRVAIRCGYSRGKNVDLFAGAGLVKGSTVEGELEEVRLKLAVLADQISARSQLSGKIF